MSTIYSNCKQILRETVLSENLGIKILTEFSAVCVTWFDCTKYIAKQFTSLLLFTNIVSTPLHSSMKSNWFFLIYTTMFVYI